MFSTTEMRRALRSVAFQFFVNGVIFATLVPRLPAIRAKLGIDLGELGVLISIATVGGILASLVADRVLARLGTKTTLVSAGLLAAGSLALVGLATNPWSFALALALLRFGDALTDIAMNMQGSQLSAIRAVPVMNRLHGLWSVGTALGGVITVQLIRFGVPVDRHLPVAGVIVAGAIVLISRGLLSEDLPAIDPPSHLPKAISRRSLISFAALGAAALTLEIVPADWATFRLVDDLDSSTTLAGWGFVAFTGGMVIGRLSGDFASMKFGQARLARGGATLAILGLAIATLAPEPSIVLGGFGLSGLGGAVVFPALYDAAARSPGRPGRALGVMTAGMWASGLLTPAAVGGLADVGGLSVGAAMLLVALAPAALLVVDPARPGERNSGIDQHG